MLKHFSESLNQRPHTYEGFSSFCDINQLMTKTHVKCKYTFQTEELIKRMSAVFMKRRALQSFNEKYCNIESNTTDAVYKCA